MIRFVVLILYGSNPLHMNNNSTTIEYLEVMPYFVCHDMQHFMIYIINIICTVISYFGKYYM